MQYPLVNPLMMNNFFLYELCGSTLHTKSTHDMTIRLILYTLVGSQVDHLMEAVAKILHLSIYMYISKYNSFTHTKYIYYVPKILDS